MSKLTSLTSLSNIAAQLLLAVLLTSCHPLHNAAAANGRELFTRLGYNRPSAHIYKVQLNDQKTGIVRQDTIALFCSDEVLAQQDSQTAMQWQFVTKHGGKYSLVDSLYDNSSTGIKVSDRFLYIHPPRHRHLQLLQFAPHPLLRIFSRQGERYDWVLPIGHIWTYPPLFRIDSVDTFQFQYQMAEISQTPNEVPCAISAISISRFGECSARFHFSRDRGLDHFEYDILHQTRISFELVDQLSKEATVALNPWFYGGNRTNLKRQF